MAKLSKSDVPGKKAGPNGSFPVGDPKHAGLAIGGATRSFNSGNIGKSTETHIKAEARKELGRGGDRKSQDFHMDRAGHHIAKAVERRLAEKDK